MVYSTEFTASELRRGCNLVTIAHALWVVEHDSFAHEHGWRDGVYVVSDSQGSFGAVAFSTTEAVGGFFDAEFAAEAVSPKVAFDGLPPRLHSLRGNALEYLHQDVAGRSRPVITAAFWTENGQIVANEPWANVFRSGAHVLRIQLMPLQEAYEACADHYEFSESRVNLLKRVHTRRIRHEDAIILSDEEFRQFVRNGDDGLDSAVELLNSIGIYVR